MRLVNNKLVALFTILLLFGHISSQSVTIQITNTCTTNLVLQCSGYSAQELEPLQLFAFNYAPTTGTVTKCRVRCRSKSSAVDIDVYGGRAPSDSNNWETADDGIYYVKRVNYYSWS